MRKQLVWLLFFFGLSVMGQGQTLVGSVLDERSGEALQQASVVLKGTGKGRITDAKGHFAFTDLAEGKYTVQVHFVGYELASRQVTVSAKAEKTELTILVRSKVYQQEQVLVTATRVGTTRDLVPLTTSVVNELEIERSTENNILPLLSGKVPGLFVTERGVSGFGVADGAAGKIAIRGVSGSAATSQVLVLIDGQPQVMGIFGHPFPDSYVSSDLEKVEVIRGPGSLLYGTNAMGGVINLITRSHDDEGFSGRAGAQYGSYNTFKTIASAAFNKKGFSVYGSFNHDETDGHRANSDFKNNSGYLKVGYEMNEHWRILLDGSMTAFTAHDPGPVDDESGSYADNAHWNDIQRGNATVTVFNSYKKLEGSAKIYFNRGDHELYTNWKSIDKNYGVSLFQGLRLFENNLLGIGLDWNRYGGKGTPVFSAFPPNAPPVVSPFNNQWIDVTETGIYTFVQHQFGEKVTANAGLRYQHHSQFGDEWIPQVGLTWKAGETTTLKSLASKGYRSPNVRELYLFPPANPDLAPERMWNYEVGLEQRLLEERLWMSATTFCSKGENLIMVVPNSNPGPPFVNMNSGTFKHHGVELEAKFRVNAGLQLDASYAYLHMDDPKVAAPKHQLYLGATYLWNNFTFSANLQQVSGLYTRIEPMVETERFALLNAKLNYKASRLLELFVSGENLTDSKYAINYGYTMPGATILTGLNLTF